MSVRSKAIQHELEELSNASDAAFLQGFFKTGEGQYGAGDRFRGIRVPALRSLARKHANVTHDVAMELLASPHHEDRVLSTMMLVRLYEKGDAAAKKAIYESYLANTSRINNWDIVDGSAPQIVGGYLSARSKAPLRRLAKSKSLWERRISIIATFQFIKREEFADALQISGMLLNDREDLIHKAVGWMLREIGKRDPRVEKAFLLKHYKKMPRTMLRYAIEKFPEEERQTYLKGNAKA